MEVLVKNGSLVSFSKCLFQKSIYFSRYAGGTQYYSRYYSSLLTATNSQSHKYTHTYSPFTHTLTIHTHTHAEGQFGVSSQP